MYVFFFFFFQAEDGIRDADVTGVQTCALPIYKKGESKLLKECSLPLTGVNCVTKVVTNLAYLEVKDGAFHLIERAPGVSVEEIKDRKSTRLNSSHVRISYAVFCLKKKKKKKKRIYINNQKI